MDDRVPIEAREEPSEPSDLIESRRRAIRKEARNAVLLGGGIVLLHLILLGAGVLELRDIFRNIIFVISICFIGIIGLIGFAIIDNAAHLGGLIAGAICGAVMIKRDSQELPIEASASIKVMGVASLLAIAGISLFSILKILHT